MIDIPDLDGPRGDPAGPLPRQAAGRRRRPAEDRAGDARLLRRRPGQRHERGRLAGRPPHGQPDHADGPGGGRGKGRGRPGTQEPPPGRRKGSAAWPITRSGTPWSPPSASTPTPCRRSASSPAAAPPWATRLQLPTDDQFLLTRRRTVGPPQRTAGRPGRGRTGLRRGKHRRRERPGTPPPRWRGG